jgi:hypothetical protein
MQEKVAMQTYINSGGDKDAPTAKEPGVKRAGGCGDSSKSWSYANSAEFKAASNQLT